MADRDRIVEAYDSRPDTFRHSLRVGELIVQVITELAERSVSHDLSKTEPPEVDVFDEYTPKLKTSTYGSDEYKSYLAGMGEGLAHHYAHNRHHPEHFGIDGIEGMTLVDMIEMLADWKAATERHDDGSLERSLRIQQERFGISDQLLRILGNTATHFGWLGEDEGEDMSHSLSVAAEAIGTAQRTVHNNAKAKGWFDNPRTFGDFIALAHSELSEALEDYRHHHEPTEVWFEDNKLRGIPIELADVVIRVMDMCEFYGIDLGAAIEQKHAYNTTRPERHGDKAI